MPAAKARGASCANATANDTSVVAATEHDRAGETADLKYELVFFLADAIAEVCHWGLCDQKCEELAIAKLNERFTADRALYDEPALVKHKEIWDMVRYDKHGNEEKNNDFFGWCRKIAAIRDADGIAQEHTASEDQVRKWYKIENAHGASHRRPDMQSLLACFCNCDEQWFRNEANIFRMHPNTIQHHVKTSKMKSRNRFGSIWC